MILIAVLAFLLGSFPARNSDLWMHLASGRLLAHGQFPLAPSAESSVHSGSQLTFLYDLISYGLYSIFGGGALVFAKALLVAGLGVVLFYRSRTAGGWCIPFLCTALALLAMSTRLLLQPATVSYLFLALTLWLVHTQTPRVAANHPSSVLPPWPLLVLFVIWANVDPWFVLGLATVALVWLGELLDEARKIGNPSGSWRTILLRRAFAFAILAAVCLLNPVHIHAFALPWDVAGFGHGTSLPSRPVMSPFQAGYLARVGVTPAGLAYFPLLGLGLLSFVMDLPRWQGRRLFPWLGLALLSAFQLRAIPFFAVVAGPVLAWNLQEFLSRRFDRERLQAPSWRRTLFLGRTLTVAAGVVLVLCAWPGWLQFTVFEPRRWAVEMPPSVQHAAETMKRWHQQGKLGPDARGLHLSADTIHAFAWLCPEEKGVLLAHLVSGEADVLRSSAAWRRRMRSAHVTHVILYEADRDRLLQSLKVLLGDPKQWPLIYQEGDLAIFGWRDAAREEGPDPFQDLQLDVDRLAFHPARDRWAPQTMPTREPHVRSWWEAFWKPLPVRSIDGQDAMLHLFQAESLRGSASFRHQIDWYASQMAALLGAAAGWTDSANLLDARVRLALVSARPPEQGAPITTLPQLERGVLRMQEGFARRRDDTSPALLYLAVRAARRALADNPDDARAYLVLGESYLRLLHDTRERAWASQVKDLAALRHVQASMALNQAVFLDPNYAQAHLSLSRLYHEMGYLDLALNHLQTYFRLLQKAGPPAGIRVEQFQAEMAQLQEEVNQLAKRVAAAEDAFVLASSSATVLERAVRAYRSGLAGKARDLLLESHLAAFGTPGMELELELLLGSGRDRDARAWLLPEHKRTLQPSAYHWFLIRALAALGDYTGAEEQFAELVEGLESDPAGERPVSFRANMALLIGQAVLEMPAVGGVLPYEIRRPFGRFGFTGRIINLAGQIKQKAEVNVLRGLLALELGAVDEAELLFRETLALWKDDATAKSGAGLDFNGRVIAQTCLHWLEQARQKASQRP